MFRVLLSAGALGLALGACSPALDWRQVDLAVAGLHAVLPCKPDRASRAITLLGRERELQMAGCEAGGALFAVSSIDLADAADRLAEAQAQWQGAMLGAMRARQPAQMPVPPSWRLPAAPGMAPVGLSAQGRRADGGAVQAQALWFAHGARLYHAAVYAERLAPEMSEPFFAGWSAP